MKKTIFIIFSIVFLFSCNGDKKNNCITSAAAIAGSYKVTAVTYKASATSPEINYFDQLYPDACEKDDIITFSANNTYVFSDAGVACVPSGNDNGTWSLSGTTSIVIDGYTAELESFDCKKLVFINPNTQTAGDRLKLTLTRQ